MNKTTLRLAAVALALCLAGPSMGAERPPPATVEGYMCNYLPGKDRADLLAARDNLVKAAEKAGIALRPSVVWHQFKGSAPAEFVWLTMHESTAAFGAAADAIMANEGTAAAMARFRTVADCRANLAIGHVVRQVENPPMGEGTTLVSTRACTAKMPATQGDKMDMGAHINSVLGSIDSFKDVPLYALEPMTGQMPGTPDVIFVGVHKSVSDWATATSELVASSAGQSLRRHFETRLDCAVTLWRGERVIAP